MKKALLSLLARSFALFLALGGGALRAAAEPYALWVGGETQVTSDNADDVFSNTTVRFEGDATGGTLTLAEADLRADPPAPFVLFTNILAETGFELAIALEGNNFVRADGDGGHGIYADGGLSIRGGGTLEVGPVPEKAIGTGGAFVVEDGAVVTAQGGSFGIGAVADIVLSNATVTAAGSNSGLYTTGGVMRILGRSTVSASGAQALYAEGGIEIGEGLAVVLPVGGGVSADGTTIVDAAGNTAEWVLIAAPGTLLGSGTEADPYVICDYATLLAFAEAVNGGQKDAWGVLAADIATTETDWTPIGTNYAYKGTFDGAGHTISGLANAGTLENAGLFGFVDPRGVVRNVRLAGVAFHGERAGGVAGVNYGTVSNSCVSGSVRGGGEVGGVVGRNFIGTVANCYNTGAVSGGSHAYVGGIVGFNPNGTVHNCHNTGAVSNGDYLGGVVGLNSGTVANSYCPTSLGVNAIGKNDGGTVEQCLSRPAAAYTQTNSFRGWDFNNVWAMGSEGPYLRVLGPTVAYPLWVDGVQVTDVNSGDILGNGSARYAGTKTWGTLRLTNAVITNAVEYQSGTSWTAGIYAGDGFDLTISLDGSNRVENAREIGEGIYAKGNLLLGGEGSLTVEGVHIGIEVSGTLHIENTTVAVSGLNGFHGENIVLSNATVSAMAGDCGIKTRTVAFTGESRVEVTATNSNGYAVYAFNDITMGDGLSLVEPSGGRVHTSGGHYFIDSNRKPALYVRIEPTAYDLWVDGVQVCSTNAEDILGDGSARFEGTEAGGTLTLSNAVITNAVAYDDGVATAAIYAGDGFELAISLDGTNRVENAGNAAGRGIRTKGNLSLGGEGSLTAKGGSGADGIAADGNLRIESTTVTASGVNGLASQGNIDFTNATVTATGSDCGIFANGAATFAGESRVEATGSNGNAVFALGGITMGDRIGVALPVGGGVSGNGTTITNAAGTVATNAIVAYFYDITVLGGSTTNSPSAAGFPVEIVADEPQDGEAFVQWSSNVEGLAFEDAGASPTWFPMPATNVTVTAVSAEIVITWEGETEYTYTGSAITPDFTVSLTNVDLHVGTNYVASWAGNTNAGTATVSVTLTNRPSGVQTNTFRIKPKPLEDGMVQLTVPDAGWWTYTGEALQPGFSLSDGNPGALTTNDVVLSWSNNVGPGIATAVFAGTNNYAGRVVKEFEIRWASETVDGTAWSYRSDLGGGTSATVTGADPAEGDVAVPETLGGLPVAGIGDGAFAGAADLTSIVVPDGVADIGEEAFAGCTALTNVWIGTGIESVGTNAFAGCDALAEVWVPVEQRGTGLLDAAGVPDGCAVRYYGTQVVTFDPNGGSCAVTTNACAFGPGATYGELPGATRAGWTFLGWFDSASGGTQVTAESAVTEEAARTLFAQWRKNADTWQAVFIANGGTGTMAPQTVRCGSPAALSANAFKRSGCTFMGWAETKDGKVAYADRAKVKDLAPAGGKKTLWAKWAKTKYAVRYEANGGRLKGGKSMAPQRMAWGKATRLRKCWFLRSGHFFLGWARKKEARVEFADEAAVKGATADGKTVTLYAQWARKVYWVTFDANGGQGKMDKQKFIYNLPDKLHKTKFTRKGWVFAGWAKTRNGEVAYPDCKAVNNLTRKGAITLYAKWKKAPPAAWTVKFDANGGTCATWSRSVKNGAAVGTLPAATRDGWKFLGWYTAKTGGSRVAATAKISANRTFFAQWERKAAAKAAKAAPAVRAAAPAASPACIAVTASGGGGDAAAVADGDETTSWTPGTAAGSWVVLTLASPCTVEDVEVVGENLPDGTRFLLSEDADDWKEGVPGRALYVWVAFPAGDAAPVVREIRLAAP